MYSNNKILLDIWRGKKNMTHEQEKNQWIKINHEIIQMLELANKDFKRVYSSMLKNLQENMIIINQQMDKAQ